jgi:uncharacterized protein
VSAPGRRCPICARTVAARGPTNKAWPFCSPRCQLIDLGAWAAEDYRVPAEADDSGGATEAMPGESSE